MTHRVVPSARIAAAFLSLVVVPKVAMAAGDGLHIVLHGSDAPPVLPQGTVLALCPGVPVPASFNANSSPGTLFTGTITFTNAELIGPCVVTAGSGTCTIDNATTASFSIVADSGGIVAFALQAMVPAGSPNSGQVCVSSTYTETPPGGGPGDPITEADCLEYQCYPVPVLGNVELAALALLLALVAALALSRRTL